MKEILITATVLILCVLLIRRVFRGKISSRLQYALWLLVAIRLIVPVSAEFDMGPFSRFRLMDLVEEDESGIGERLGETIRLEEPIHMTVNSSSILFRLFTTDEIRETLENTPEDGPTSVFLVGTLGFSRLDVLWFLWWIGALAVGVWILAANMLFSRRLRKRRKPYDLPEDIKEFVLKGREYAGGESKASSDLRSEEDSQGKKFSRFWGRKDRLPAIYLAEGISSPCLYGFPGREAVYLTADVIDDASRLRHVVVHELVHKKHGDGFWAILRAVLVTVYWFHPLVWVAAACSKRDCELACDEGTLALLGEEERVSYGETLLSIITRKGRVSDLVCTATTMTGSGKSVKERICFIAKEPKVIYAAVAGALFLIAAVCLFVFTKDARFRGITVDAQEGLTVTGADMQIPLPASIGGISGCVVEKKTDEVVIYHVAAQEEVGRFSRIPLRDALGFVDEGREVVPVGDRGCNYFLRAYMGEPLTRTEHLYFPSGEGSGVLKHEDIYFPEEDILKHEDTIEAVPGDDENPLLSKDWEVIPLEEDEELSAETRSESTLGHEDIHTPVEDKTDYLPNEEIVVVESVDPAAYEKSTMHTYTPAEEEDTHITYTPTEDAGTGNGISEGVSGTDTGMTAGVPGTDSNDDDTTYIVDEDDATYIIDDNTARTAETQEEVSVDYLPDEEITTTVYPPREVDIDRLDNRCYVYIRAAYDSRVKEKYRDEMAFIDSELKSAADQVIILSLNRERREALFDALCENRTPYVGDNAKVGALIDALPLPSTLNRSEGFSLQTLEEPYSLRVDYEMSTDYFTQEDQDMLYFNAAMLFYSIGNVEEISSEIKHPSGKNSEMKVYYREELEKELPILQSADYEDDQNFRDGLAELQTAVETHLQAASGE